MAEAAEFVARHLILAGARKARAYLCDKAWHHHCVDVRAGEQETVHRIRARQAELYRRVGRHADAVRHEIILLGDHAHCRRAVGLDRGAEIAFDELTGEMQRLRLDDLDIARGMQSAGDPGNDDHRHHDGQHPRHQDYPALLRAVYDLLRDDAVRKRPRS